MYYWECGKTDIHILLMGVQIDTSTMQWHLPISTKITNSHTLWVNNFVSRHLSYKYVCTEEKLLTGSFIVCNNKAMSDFKLEITWML